MRWLLVGRHIAHIYRFKFFTHALHLPLQRIQLFPLGGDDIIQFGDDPVLMGHADFERVEAGYDCKHFKITILVILSVLSLSRDPLLQAPCKFPI